MRRTVGRALATLAMIGLAAGACSSTQDASTDTTASATKSQSGEITEYTVPAGSDVPQTGGSLVYGLEAETDGRRAALPTAVERALARLSLPVLR